MDKILTMVVKVATLLTTLAMLALTVWSLASGQPALMSVVGVALTAVFGFFSFVDIRNMVRGK
jgi:hypothetical protein